MWDSNKFGNYYSNKRTAIRWCLCLSLVSCDTVTYYSSFSQHIVPSYIYHMRKWLSYLFVPKWLILCVIQ